LSIALIALTVLTYLLTATAAYSSEPASEPLLKVVNTYQLFSAESGGMTAFSSDGGRFVLVSGQSIQVGDISTGKPVFEAPSRPGFRARSAAMDKSGRIAALSLKHVDGFNRDITVIWDVDSGQPIAEIGTPGSWLIALSPDGKRLASVDYTGHLEMFEIADRAKLATTKIAANNVLPSSMTFSPNGEALVVGVDFGELYWRDSHTLLAAIPPWSHLRTGAGTKVTFSPSGDRILLFDLKHAVIIDTRSGDQLSSPLHGHRDNHVESATFSNDGHHLFTVGSDGMVGVWNASNGRRLAMSPVWMAQQFWGRAYVSSNGRTAVAVGRSDRVSQMQTAQVAELEFLPPKELPAINGPRRVARATTGKETGIVPEAASFHRKSGRIALGGSGAVWIQHGARECSTESIFFTDPGHQELAAIKGTTFSQSGRLIAVNTGESIYVFSADTCRRASKVKGSKYVNAMAFMPDESLLYATNKTLRRFDTKVGKITYSKKFDIKGEITAVTAASDGSVAVGTTEGEVMLKSLLPDASPRNITDLGNTSVWHLMFASDGKQLIAGMRDGTIRVIDAGTAQVLPAPKFLVGDDAEDNTPLKLGVWAIAISDDEQRLGAIYEDGTVRVWEMTTGAPITYRLLGGLPHSSDLMFEENGDLVLATAFSTLRWKLP
jgi:WD40 repeat protein